METAEIEECLYLCKKVEGQYFGQIFEDGARMKIPSEMSQPLTNMGQGIRNFNRECHFNLK